MIPSRIRIRREKGFHTDCLGRFGDKQQFMGFAFFLESGQRRPAAVLHRFDANGEHLGSEIWETSTMVSCERSLAEAVAKLPQVKAGHILIRPFSVELNGIEFGLVAGDDESLEYVPYGLVFSAPWNGTYDT
jgi:hypothetical protein